MYSTLSRLWFIPFSVDLCHCAPPPHPHPILNYNPVFQSTGIWKPLVSQTSRISSTPGSWTSWFKIPRKLIPFSCSPIRHSDLFRFLVIRVSLNLLSTLMRTNTSLPFRNLWAYWVGNSFRFFISPSSSDKSTVTAKGSRWKNELFVKFIKNTTLS